MVATRLAFVAATCLTLLSTAEASPSYSLFKRANLPENRPYAPDLYSRAALESEEGKQVVKRGVQGSRPYAPDLFSRSLLSDDEEENDFALRSQIEYGQVYLSSKESAKAARCVAGKFYNSAHAACEDKLTNKAACLSDNECESGFCGPKSKCSAKKAIGSRCSGLHSACESSYCSATQDVCKARVAEGESCVITAGCQEGLSCINAKCHLLRASPSKRSMEEGEVSKRTMISPPQGSNHRRAADLTQRSTEEAATKRTPISPPQGSSHRRAADLSPRTEEAPTKRTFISPPMGSSHRRAADLRPRSTEEAPSKSKRSMSPVGSSVRRAAQLEESSFAPSKRDGMPSAPRSMPSGGYKRQIDLSPR